MIDFSDRTYRNILQEQLDTIPNDIDKREGSVTMTALGPESYALAEVYNNLHYYQLQGYLLTASGEALDMLAAAVPAYRKQATYATRKGIFDTNIPLESRFMAPNGANSVIFRAILQMGAGVYQMAAETAGQIGNEYSGPIIPITYISGLSSAVLADILIPGTNTEDDESFRARALDLLNAKPFGGNVADYRKNILEMDGVGAVEVFPVWNGGGTVCCSILDGNYNPATSELVQLVQNIVNPFLTPDDFEGSPLGTGTAPIGARATITTPSPYTVNIVANITLSAGFTLGQVQQPVAETLEAYFLSVRRIWDNPVDPINVKYASYIYISQVSAAILQTQGIVNVTGIKLNGQSGDITLNQTGHVQNLPILGSVDLNAAAAP